MNINSGVGRHCRECHAGITDVARPYAQGKGCDMTELSTFCCSLRLMEYGRQAMLRGYAALALANPDQAVLLAEIEATASAMDQLRRLGDVA